MLGTARDVSEREELRSRLRDLDAVYRFADAVAGARALDEVLEAALDALLEATGADRASVLLADDDGVLRFRAWRGLSDRYRAYTEGRSPWPPDVSDPQPVLVEDVADRYEPALLRVMRKEGIAALAFVPLVRGGAQLSHSRSIATRRTCGAAARCSSHGRSRTTLHPSSNERRHSTRPRARACGSRSCSRRRSSWAGPRLRRAPAAGAAAGSPAHRRRLPRLHRAERRRGARPGRARPRGSAHLGAPRRDRRRVRRLAAPAHPRHRGLPHGQADPPALSRAPAEEGRASGRGGARAHGVPLARRRAARDGRQATRRARRHLGRARPARGRGPRARLGARAAGLARARPRRPPPAGAGLARPAAGRDRAAAARRRDHRRGSPHRAAERRGRAGLGRACLGRLGPPDAGHRRLAARASSREGRGLDRRAPRGRTGRWSSHPGDQRRTGARRRRRDRLGGRDPRRRHAPQPRGGAPPLPRPRERAARRQRSTGSRRSPRSPSSRCRRSPATLSSTSSTRTTSCTGSSPSTPTRRRPSSSGSCAGSTRRRSRPTRSRSPSAPASRSCCRTCRPRRMRWRTTPSTAGRSADREHLRARRAARRARADARHDQPRDVERQPRFDESDLAMAIGARAPDLARARQRAPLLGGPGARPCRPRRSSTSPTASSSSTRLGIVRLWNPTAAISLRRLPAEAVGRPVAELLADWPSLRARIPSRPSPDAGAVAATRRCRSRCRARSGGCPSRPSASRAAPCTRSATSPTNGPSSR